MGWRCSSATHYFRGTWEEDSIGNGEEKSGPILVPHRFSGRDRGRPVRKTTVLSFFMSFGPPTQFGVVTYIGLLGK